MIFKDLILELQEPVSTVSTAVEELFNAAYAHQTHPQDLLLVHQHGFFFPAKAEPPGSGPGRMSPYMIGPSDIGYARETFNEFVDWFRRSHMLDKSSWEDQVAQDMEKQKQERLTIQVEQGLYLRFWEDDWPLKGYHQLSSLAVGRPYDWHLKIPSYARGGSKHEFIRKNIRDRIERVCPTFYTLIKKTTERSFEMRLPTLNSVLHHIGSSGFLTTARIERRMRTSREWHSTSGTANSIRPYYCIMKPSRPFQSTMPDTERRHWQMATGLRFESRLQRDRRSSKNWVWSQMVDGFGSRT